MHVAQRLKEMLNNANAYNSKDESMQQAIHECNWKYMNAPSREVHFW